MHSCQICVFTVKTVGIWIRQQCIVKCSKICPFNLSCSCVMTYWTWMKIKNLALLPKIPPSLLIAALMGLQGQYQNPKETVLFPVDPLFTILRRKEESKYKRAILSLGKQGSI